LKSLECKEFPKAVSVKPGELLGNPEDQNVILMNQYIDNGPDFKLTDETPRFNKTDRKQGLRKEFHFLLKHLGDGALCIQTLLDQYEFETVADIGTGVGWHTDIFRRHNKNVTAIELGEVPKIKFGDSQTMGNFQCRYPTKQFDVVWANHVAEHMMNLHLFFVKVFDMLKEGGILALSVPTMKTLAVGGHVSLWTGGMLIQHLIRAGFHLKYLRLIWRGYNLSIILKKKSIKEKIRWVHDKGDIKLMIPYLPDVLVKANAKLLKKDALNGNILTLNW